MSGTRVQFNVRAVFTNASLRYTSACNYAHLSALRYPAVLCRNRPAQHRQATAVAHMGACCKWLQVAPEVSSWPSAVPSAVPVRLLLGSAPQ